MPRDEVEAAYFTLLRARDELARLQRYDDYLAAESQRLRRTISEGAALTTGVDDGVRRVLSASDDVLRGAIEARLVLLDDERTRLPARLEAAVAFVTECERAHAAAREEGG
jgi:hypothetical protein